MNLKHGNQRNTILVLRQSQWLLLDGEVNEKQEQQIDNDIIGKRTVFRIESQLFKSFMFSCQRAFLRNLQQSLARSQVNHLNYIRSTAIFISDVLFSLVAGQKLLRNLALKRTWKGAFFTKQKTFVHFSCFTWNSVIYWNRSKFSKCRNYQSKYFQMIIITSERFRQNIAKKKTKKHMPRECVWFTHLLKNDHFGEINRRWVSTRREITALRLPWNFFSPHISYG